MNRRNFLGASLAVGCGVFAASLLPAASSLRWEKVSRLDLRGADLVSVGGEVYSVTEMADADSGQAECISAPGSPERLLHSETVLRAY